MSYEDTYVDSSACNQPDKHDRVVYDADCTYTTSTDDCCTAALEDYFRDSHICPPNKDKSCAPDTWP